MVWFFFFTYKLSAAAVWDGWVVGWWCGIGVVGFWFSCTHARSRTRLVRSRLVCVVLVGLMPRLSGAVVVAATALLAALEVVAATCSHRNEDKTVERKNLSWSICNQCTNNQPADTKQTNKNQSRLRRRELDDSVVLFFLGGCSKGFGVFGGVGCDTKSNNRIIQNVSKLHAQMSGRVVKISKMQI